MYKYKLGDRVGVGVEVEQETHAITLTIPTLYSTVLVTPGPAASHFKGVKYVLLPLYLEVAANTWWRDNMYIKGADVEKGRYMLGVFLSHMLERHVKK